MFAGAKPTAGEASIRTPASAWLVAVVVVALVAGCRQPVGEPYDVVGIIDGDTLRATKDGSEFEIRLQGIECPELTQPHGMEAALLVADLCKDRRIYVTERRREGNRIFGMIYSGGHDLHRELCAAGLAWVIDEALVDEESAALAAQAMTSFTGIWSDIHQPCEPAEWRKLTAPMELDEGAHPDQKALQGIWRCEVARWQGRDNEGSIGAYYIFRGDQLISFESPWRFDRKYVLDPVAEPPAIDYEMHRMDGLRTLDEVVTVRGIYRLDGDLLILCNSRHSQPRPTEFGSLAGDVGSSYLELRRVKTPPPIALESPASARTDNAE